MVFTVSDLNEILRIEKGDYEERINLQVQKLTLRQVILATEEENPIHQISERINYRFNDGDYITFSLGEIKIIMGPQSTTLSVNHMRLKEFSGVTVDQFYNRFSRKLMANIERYLETLPF